MHTAITRRGWLAGSTAAALTSPFCATAQGSYPAWQTIKFIVPFPPGGSTDTVGRIVADRLGAKWNVTTIVENVAGAGTNIGSDRAAKGPADGTTILLTASPMVANQFLYAKLSYDPVNDLIPLAQIAIVPIRHLPCADCMKLRQASFEHAPLNSPSSTTTFMPVWCGDDCSSATLSRGVALASPLGPCPRPGR